MVNGGAKTTRGRQRLVANTITRDCRVYLQFALYLEDGSVIDDSSSNNMVDFTMGDGSLLPYIEKKLLGSAAGDATQFSIAAKDGFGEYNILNSRRVTKDKFNTVPPKCNEVIMFEDGRGGHLPGVVKEISEQWVEVDFNHPLAGKNLIFKYKIIDIKNG